MGQKDGDLIFGKLRNEEIYDLWVRNGYHVRFLGGLKKTNLLPILDIVRENGTYVECSFDIRVIG